MVNHELQREVVRKFCQIRIVLLRKKGEELLWAREEMEKREGRAPRAEYSQNSKELEGVKKEQLLLMTDFDVVVDAILRLLNETRPVTIEARPPTVDRAPIVNTEDTQDTDAEKEAIFLLGVMTSMKPPFGAMVGIEQDDGGPSEPTDTNELRAMQVESAPSKTPGKEIIGKQP